MLGLIKTGISIVKYGAHWVGDHVNVGGGGSVSVKTDPIQASVGDEGNEPRGRDSGVPSGEGLAITPWMATAIGLFVVLVFVLIASMGRRK